MAKAAVFRMGFIYVVLLQNLAHYSCLVVNRVNNVLLRLTSCLRKIAAVEIVRSDQLN